MSRELPSEGTKIPIEIKPAIVTNRSSRFAFESSQPIKWTKGLGSNILGNLSLDYPYSKTDLSNIDDINIRSSFSRFLLSLDAYNDSGGWMDGKEIILRTCLEGPSFTALLKKYKKQVFLSQIECISIQEDYVIKAPEIRDIGEIFNYYFLPFWEEEVNDLELSKVSLPVEEDILNQFEEKMRELLEELSEEEIDWASEIETLISISGSSSYDSKASCKPVYKVKGRPSFSRKIHRAKRTIVPVCAGNFRDTIILNKN